MMNLANASSETPPVRLAKAGATRVLVVDDEPTLRRSVVRMLTASGMEAIPVEDGSAALALLFLLETSSLARPCTESYFTK